MWRWDQGHLQLLSFQSVRAISRAMLPIEHIDLHPPDGSDPLRIPLETTGLDFKAPPTHSIWRQYKRAFECGLVATTVNDKLVLTEMGRRLAVDDTITSDEYLAVVTKRFRYPFPAFNNYEDTSPRVYPFCAVLKFLFAKFLAGQPATLSPEELESKIIGNGCTGEEPIEFYATLPTTGYTFQGVEERQTREMLVFISQFSFLKAGKSLLELDIAGTELSDELLQIASPDSFAVRASRAEELMLIAQPTATDFVEFNLPSRDEPSDEEFTEGNRIRKTHVRIERSPGLRKAFFNKYDTRQCDMCGMLTNVRYPWAKNLLELHHLLPLSSAIAVNLRKGTLLKDVVPLCPTCHRGVHSYYRVWLNARAQSDFSSKQEAIDVYLEAKDQLGA